MLVGGRPPCGDLKRRAELCRDFMIIKRQQWVLFSVVVGAMLLSGCATYAPVTPVQRMPDTPTIDDTLLSAEPEVAEPSLSTETDGALFPGTTGLSLSLGDEIALRAIALVGKPYRYGGADLDGFDCSGLVYYIHEALGLMVPRTAADQQRAAMSVKRSALQPGDLLFFRTTSTKRISHVGVYVGDNRFVHAPQSGKLIELRSMDDAYYRKRLAGTGRLYSGS